MNEEEFKDQRVEIENVQVPAADIKIEMRTLKDLEDAYEGYYDDGATVSPLFDGRTRMSFIRYLDDGIILYDAQA